MKYLSVCSGIEAASVAWELLGWRAVGYSEIEPFPSAVLAHRFPDVPNLGDMTNYGEWKDETIDILVGGTPCQSFSNAGMRRGMDDSRGQLAFAFSGIVEKYRPRWIVWENVPGVLSSGGGRDFGSFIQSLVKLGYGLSWRVLDAQYFGLAQRRKRVFVVGYLGDWRHSTAVLFESKGLCGHFEKGRKKEQGTPKDSGLDLETECLSCGVMWEPDGGLECCPMCGASQGYCPDKAATLETTANDYSRADGFCMIVKKNTARRLTPRECERLQGFPDDWTLIPWRGKQPDQCPDGPRYKAIGNSMAVPVMRWIGQRIQMVENLANG